MSISILFQKGLAFVEFESKANLEDGEENDVPRIGLLDAGQDFEYRFS